MVVDEQGSHSAVDILEDDADVLIHSGEKTPRIAVESPHQACLGRFQAQLEAVRREQDRFARSGDHRPVCGDGPRLSDHADVGSLARRQDL